MLSVGLYLKKLNITEKIILINIFLYIVFQIITFVFSVSEVQLQTWIGLPQQAHKFVLHPWTLLTYFWFHASAMHLFWNSVLLYFSGHIFLNLYSSKNFLNVYLLSGILGGVLFFLVGLLFPSLYENSILLGASGAIMGVFIFVSSMIPQYSVTVFLAFRVKLWHIALLIILTDLLQLSTNTGGRIVHLSSALVGFVYALYAQKYGLICFEKIFNNKKSKKVNNNKKKYLSFSSKEDIETTSMTENQRMKQRKINQILDKIGSSGYTALSEEEKKSLFEISKEMQD